MSLYHSPKIVTDGLVLYLDAGNRKSYVSGSVNIYDLSKNINSGSLMNGLIYDSTNGGSLIFDGVDDYIQLPSEFNLPNWSFSLVYSINYNHISRVFLKLQNNTNVITQELGTFYGLYNITLDNENNIYAGSFGIYKYRDEIRFCAVKINNDGTVNNLNFNYNPAGAVSIENILIKSDNSYGFIAGTNLNTLARFNTTTGQKVQATGINSNIGNRILFLDEINNHVYLGGDFTTINGISYSRLARFDMDTLVVDNTFDTSNGFNSTVYSAIKDSNGKIYVLGVFTSYKGVTCNRIVRLNNDGSIDTTFNIGTGINISGNPTKFNIILDQNNKPILSGNITSYNGTSCNYIIRLNTDGTRDTSFVGSFDRIVYNSAYDEINQKIYFVGDFTSYNGTSCNRIIRLNLDGTKDNTFNIGTGFNNYMESIAIQSDGKVIVGEGTINSNRTYTRTYNTTHQFSSFIRLNYDGSVDTTFDAGLGFTEGTYRNSHSIRYLNSSNSPINLIEYVVFPANGNRLQLDFFKNYYDNKFHILTITKHTDERYRLYEDGVLRNTLTSVPSGSNTSLIFQKVFGRNLQSIISIYNRALTAADIQQNYKALKGRFKI